MLPRLPNSELQEPYFCSATHGELTADTPVRLDKIPAGKRVRVEHVQYINPTGLAADNTNAFRLSVRKNHGAVGAVEVALVFNTDGNDDPAGAALDADTWVTASLTAANVVLEAGDTLDLLFDEDGTATLPADGRIVIRGRYV